MSEPSVKALAAQVAHLRGQVAELTKALAGLNDEGNVFKPYAPNWVGLTTDQHAAKVADLAKWVDTVLTPEYLRRPLRSCWPQHRPVLWELSTLRAAWYKIWSGKYPDLDGGQLFLDRWLPNTVARVELSLADCSTDCALVNVPVLNGPVPIRPARPRPA